MANFTYKTFVGVLILAAVIALASAFPVSGYKLKVVKSGSMEPEIHTGSVVMIRPTADYAEGDIVTFGENSKDSVPTTHRIVAVRVVEGAVFYQTKGDANDSPDGGEIHKDEIIGKVAFTVPFLGYVIEAARTPLGFFFLIIVPASIVAIGEIGTIWREIRRMRSKKASPGADATEPEQT